MNRRDGYKTKLAKAVGYTVQMVSIILAEKANASTEKAKLIDKALKGGGVLVWTDSAMSHKRKEVFDKYKGNLK